MASGQPLKIVQRLMPHPVEDYKTNGLVAPTATFPCQSKIHNKESPAILTTFFNWTKVQGSRVGLVHDILIIPIGTIVNILSTR
jgi:hypothetical protein